MTLSGTMSASTLNTDFDTCVPTTNTGTNNVGQLSLGKPWNTILQVQALASTDSQGKRMVLFTPQDDIRLKCWHLQHKDTAAAKTITGSIQAVNPSDLSTTGFEDYQYAGDESAWIANITLTSVNGLTRVVQNCEPSGTGARYLYRGITYKLEVTNSGAAGVATVLSLFGYQYRRTL